MIKKKRIYVLGAGLSGLSAAWHLKKKGIACHVFEKEKELGGLCRTKNTGGFTFDYDGHLLHFKHAYTFNLLKNLLGNNLVAHKRSAWIYCYDKYIRYPFQANLYGLPHPVIKDCLVGFIQAQENNPLRENKADNFLDWINQVFGKGIAGNFLIPYNTKFWTIPPNELTCEWIDDFIPVPSLRQIIEGTIEESKRQLGYNTQFWYPKKGGINQVALALAGSIKNVYTDSKITGIDFDSKEIRLASGNKERFDYLISTIPFLDIAYIARNLPENIAALFKKLRCNSIFNLNLGIDKKDDLKRHWVYYPQKEICFFRVGFFHNFSSCLAPPDKSSLYIEVAYSENMPIDKSEIVCRIKKDLRKVGVIGKDDKICVEDINDIKYGYPIYDKNYSLARKEILKFLLKNNIIPCGRYGSWRYMSIEESVLDGMHAANRIC